MKLSEGELIWCIRESRFNRLITVCWFQPFCRCALVLVGGWSDDGRWIVARSSGCYELHRRAPHVTHGLIVAWFHPPPSTSTSSIHQPVNWSWRRIDLLLPAPHYRIVSGVTVQITPKAQHGRKWFCYGNKIRDNKYLFCCCNQKFCCSNQTFCW